MGQLSNFVVELVKKENEQLQWEHWLHKVFDKGFEEYKEECKKTHRTLAMSDKQVDATKNKARGILKNFKPT